MLQWVEFPEWIATVAFYRAVHLVEAAFAADPAIQHTWDHRARREALKKNLRYRDVNLHYAHLMRTSIIARYLSESAARKEQYAKFTDYMSAEQVRKEIVGYRLRQLERAIAALAGPVPAAPKDK